MPKEAQEASARGTISNLEWAQPLPINAAAKKSGYLTSAQACHVMRLACITEFAPCHNRFPATRKADVSYHAFRI